MNKLFAFLLLALTITAAPTASLAAIKGAPFIPEVDSRFDSIERIGPSVAPYGSSTASQLANQPVARFVYDVLNMGGASGSDIAVGLVLPSEALITETYYHVVNSFAGTGASIRFYCAESGDNLLNTHSITDMTAGANNPGSNTMDLSTVYFVGPEAGLCTVKAHISGASLSAGRLEFFISYVVAQ